MDYIIELHPWDVAEEGARQTVERVAALGVQGVSLTAVWPGSPVFRPRAPAGRLHVPERAEAHFRPSPERWSDRGLRPHPAEVVQIEDYFETLPEIARAEGLAVEARLVALPYAPPPPPAFQPTNRPPVRPYPAERFYARNAYGDRLPGFLCPSYDETREYLASLVADAGRYDVSAVAVESFGFPIYDFSTLPGARALAESPAAKFLAGVCFCDKCFERGEASGIETAPMAWRVRNFLDRCLSGSAVKSLPADSPEDLAEIDEQLPAYLRMRAEIVGSLASELRSAMRPEVKLNVFADWREGAAAESVAEGADQIRLPGGAGDASALVLDVSVAVEKVAGRAEVSARLVPGSPQAPSAERLAELAAVSRDLGLQSVVISSFGELAPAHLEWIPQAIRA